MFRHNSRHSTSLQKQVFTRWYVPHTDPEFPHWPHSPNPTPYEIFKLSKTFQKNELKSKFNQLAKVYHPDVSHSIPIKGPGGTDLNSDFKDERFKKILLAYQILKDDKKRSAYDQFQTGWDQYRPPHKSVYRDPMNRPMYTAYNRHQDSGYWNSGTWEDDYFRRQKQEPIDPELQKQFKRNFTIAITLFILVTGTLQFMGAQHLSTEDHRKRLNLDNKCKEELSRVYGNYGHGDERMEKIQRFLIFRDSLKYHQDTKELEIPRLLENDDSIEPYFNKK